MTDAHKKRKHERVPIRIEAQMRSAAADTDGRILEAQISDVSVNGAFIETDVSFKTGKVVAFSLNLPPHDQQRLIFGRVRWRNEGEPRGLGIEFVQTRSLNRSLKIIAAHLKRSLDEKRAQP